MLYVAFCEPTHSVWLSVVLIGSICLFFCYLLTSFFHKPFQNFYIFWILGLKFGTHLQEPIALRCFCPLRSGDRNRTSGCGDIRTSTRNSVVCLFCLYYCLFTFCKRKQRNMDHLAVCGSNLLKLGGCLHLTLIHNPEFLGAS
jgi:hypothetical protein